MQQDVEYGLLRLPMARQARSVVQVQPGKQRALLAAVLFRGGRLAGLDGRVRVLSGTRPPPAQVCLRRYVFRLHRARGSRGDPVVVTEPGDYRIAIGPGQLDTGLFEVPLSAGRTAVSAGGCAHAAGAPREGLALWRREPLTGIGSEILAAEARGSIALAEQAGRENLKERSAGQGSRKKSSAARNSGHLFLQKLPTRKPGQAIYDHNRPENKCAIQAQHPQLCWTAICQAIDPSAVFGQVEDRMN